jgi:hypothetical protein
MFNFGSAFRTKLLTGLIWKAYLYESAYYDERGWFLEPDPDHGWIRVHDAPKYAKKFVESYIAQKQLTCCSFQGGFMIWTDGRH